jgi:hypothetical protein
MLCVQSAPTAEPQSQRPEDKSCSLQTADMIPEPFTQQILSTATEYKIWYVACNWHSSDVRWMKVVKRYRVGETNYKQLNGLSFSKRNNNTFCFE